MKYLIIFCILFAAISFVSSSCTTEDQQGIAECFVVYEKALNRTLLQQEMERHFDTEVRVVEDYVCQPHNDYARCLEAYDMDCLNPDNAKKIFGTSILLIYYYILNYECNQEYKVALKDIRCAAKLFYIAEFDKENLTCEQLKKYINSYKNKVVEKCGNEKYAEYRQNLLLFVVSKLLPKCVLE
uniref:Uncharacterized protein n=1 Tax=Panagrolaimus superbus TaxID=310955 RepID=A0A914YMC6_9BILA